MLNLKLPALAEEAPVQEAAEEEYEQYNSCNNERYANALALQLFCLLSQ